jgi:hypothetical protein
MTRTRTQVGTAGPTLTARWLAGLGLAAALIAACGELAAAPARATAAECGTYSGTGCAPDSRRVDLGTPSFSNPTQVVNPLFPVSELHSVVLLGREEGRRFRSETTLLPGTRIVVWNGQRISVLVSQYMAWRDGRLEEVALDRYAQADDGSVWYLGEDVVDYERGHVFTTEGTWLAGREGPPAMIMPAHPQVGDVFRTENVIGIVFEEVTVKAVDRIVAGPHGPVAGAMVGEELHLDETTERKTFAPGYGEFLTGAGRNVEALAIAVPTDALPAPVPAPLERMATGAQGMLASVEAEDWRAAAGTLRRMHAAWREQQASGQPRLIAARLDSTLAALGRAVRRHRARRASQASIDTAQSVLDLQLRHRLRGAVDRDRLELWCQQLRVDAAAHHRAAVSGDAATLGWIRDRIADTLTPDELRAVDTQLGDVQTAADGRRLAAAADHAARLVGVLRAIPRL